MPNLKSVLVPDSYYHIYNGTVGNEKFFPREENYSFFLSLFRKYISPIADLYSFCLLPDEFDFFLYIKNEYLIFQYMQNKNTQPASGKDIELFLLQQFSNYFNAYAKAYNKFYRR